MINIDQYLLDSIGKKEVQALIDGLDDPEMSRNPQFLARVRNFLKDNNMLVVPEKEEVQEIQDKANAIPDFMKLVGEDD